MRPELSDFAGGFLAHVNRNADHADKGRDKSACHQPGGNVTDAQCVIKRPPTCDRFRGRQDEILAHQFFPFTLKHLTIFHHHRDEKVRLQHSDPGAEGIVKAIASRLDPEHHPNDGEIEKENDVRNVAIRKGDGDNGGAAGDGPVCRDIESLPPDHDAPEFAPVKMRHGIDVAGIVNASLQRNGCFVFRGGRGFFCCHSSWINWITASPE